MSKGEAMKGYAPFLGQVRLKMGAVIIEPTGGGAPGAAPAAVPAYQPRPSPFVIRRFEIKDEEGNFIPNAAVTVTTSEGRHFLTKLSDAGGNVAISMEEADAAARAVSLNRGSLLYTVNAPGRSPVNGVFFTKDMPPEDLFAVKEIILKQEGDVSYWPYALIGTALLGTIVYFAVKS